MQVKNTKVYYMSLQDKKDLLHEFMQEPLHEMQDQIGGERIVNILKAAGLHTFGELDEYRKKNNKNLSMLPGITADEAQTLHAFIVQRVSNILEGLIFGPSDLSDENIVGITQQSYTTGRGSVK